MHLLKNPYDQQAGWFKQKKKQRKDVIHFSHSHKPVPSLYSAVLTELHTGLHLLKNINNEQLHNTSESCIQGQMWRGKVTFWKHKTNFLKEDYL